MTPEPLLTKQSPAEAEGGLLRNNVLVGILFMLGSAIVFPVMNAGVKHLTAEYSVLEITWARNLGHLLFVLALFVPRVGIVRLLRTRHPRMQFARSGLFLVSNVCFFTALSFIPLALASSISFTAPLIVTALSVPFLGEKVGWRRWSAVAVGFIGALIIIRPGMTTIDWAAGLVLISASCYATYQLLTRKVAREDSAETSVFYSALVGTVVLTLVLPFVWKGPGILTDMLIMSTIGILGGLGHYCIARAFTYGPAAILSPFNYAQLVGAALLGYLVFGDMPDALAWLGAAVIVASGLYVAYRETVVRKR